MSIAAMNALHERIANLEQERDQLRAENRRLRAELAPIPQMRVSFDDERGTYTASLEECD